MEKAKDYLLNKNWTKLKYCIKNNQVDWYSPIDLNNYAIHILTYHNQNEIIKMIKKEIIVEIIFIKNQDGDTCAHIASKLNNTSILEYFFSVSINVLYLHNAMMNTPLFYILQNIEFLKKLVTQFEVIDHYLNNDFTLLDFIAKHENIELFNYFLLHVSLGEQSVDLLTNMIEIENDDVAVGLIQILLRRYPFFVNAINSVHMSPIIVAVYSNKKKIVKYLLEKGADPSYSGPEKTNHPLTIAILNQNIDLIKLLIDHKVDLNTRDKYLRTPLHYLFESRVGTDLKMTLLHLGDDINIPDDNYDTVLGLLLKNESWKPYRVILSKKKLDIHIKNKQEISPLDLIKRADMKSFFNMVYSSYIFQLQKNDSVKWKNKLDQKISQILKEKNIVPAKIKTELITKIKEVQSYPTIKQTTWSINLPVPKSVNITHFSASLLDYIAVTCMFLQHYPSLKIASFSTKKLNLTYQEITKAYRDKNNPLHKKMRHILMDYFNHSPLLVNHIMLWYNENCKYVPQYLRKGIKTTLKKYPKTKLIWFKLTILTDMGYNHANILIYDIARKSVERFDPLGNVSFIPHKSIDEFFETYFKEVIPGITYFPVSDLTKNLSFQSFSDESNPNNLINNDPKGFCVAWCLWYLELRINNYHVDQQMLIRAATNIINRDNANFKEYIRNYSDNLNGMKEQLFGMIGVPWMYWNHTSMPIENYVDYVLKIRKMFKQIV